MLPLRTSQAARLCWMAMPRARYRYAVTSRLAERRDDATHEPRTALTVMDRSKPSTTNTMISSTNVSPA